MTIDNVGGLITNIIGLGIVGGVAMKTMDMVDKQTRNKKKKKKAKDIFDWNIYGY